MTTTQKKQQYEPTLDRFTGCLLGGALGDALGWKVEFTGLSGIREKFGLEGIQEPAANADSLYEITDDTQMTLFTAEGCLSAWAMARHCGPPPDFQKNLHQAYLRWLHTQKQDGVDHGGWLLGILELHNRRAPGGTCLSSLANPKAGTIQGPINDRKGSGGIMRVAPAGLLAARIIDGTDEAIGRFAFELGSLAASITHGHPTGHLSAGYLAGLISALCRGMELEPAMECMLPVLKARQGSQETAAAVENATALAMNQTAAVSPETIETLGSGWTGEEALAIALYCSLVAQDDFTKAVRLAVNHSGDSDSTGSITGNILGALHGEQALPTTWLQRLELADVIRQMADDLFTTFQGTQSWLQKYLPMP